MSENLFDMRGAGVVSFEEFWRAYPPRGRTPRRHGKKDARIAFAGVPVSDHPDMMAGLERDKKSRDWLEPRFIPHAHRWIRKRRWEDEEPETNSFSPKERSMLKTWRNRVGGGCPHPDPACEFQEDCNERQLRRWTKAGLL